MLGFPLCLSFHFCDRLRTRDRLFDRRIHRRLRSFHRSTRNSSYSTSDCGTNFKEADQQLKSLFSEASERKKFASLISNDGTKWNFNLPSASHFGGKLEAGVKSMKYHLKRVVRTTFFMYEMSTLLTRIETILNSRPGRSQCFDTSSLPCGAFVNSHIQAELDTPQTSQTFAGNKYVRWYKVFGRNGFMRCTIGINRPLQFR